MNRIWKTTTATTLLLGCLTGALLLLGALIGGCNDAPPAPQYAFMTWRMRCEDTGSCLAPNDRRIENIDGEDGVSINCSASVSGETRALFLSAQVPGQYGIEIRNVRLAAGGGAIQSGGTVRAFDGANIYEGLASANPVPTEQPAPGDTTTPTCRISSVQITSTSMLKQITGELYCRWMANEADATLTRELTAAGDDPARAALPATFEFQNCQGL